MSLTEFATNKALQFALNVFTQVDKSIRTESGSGVRAFLLVPFSFLYAAVVEEAETLRSTYLGNYQNISEEDMDVLATNYLMDRPQGTRAVANLRLYVDELQAFELRTIAYFQNTEGVGFRPISNLSFFIEDIVQDDEGEFYVNVPVIALEFGPGGQSGPGDIKFFSGLPIVATRVSNPDATEGGFPESDNSQFFDEIQDSINNGSLLQENGLLGYISEQFPEISETLIVDAGHSSMIRDELWSEDGVTPNLTRSGEPLATHLTVGSIDFNSSTGRGVLTSGEDLSEKVNARIALANDIEGFRTIISFDEDTNQMVLSGPPLEGVYEDSKIYSFGPQISNMADVYMYLPQLQINSAFVDKSTNLIVKTISFANPDIIQFSFEENSDVTSLQEGGRVVFFQGTEDEQIIEVTSIVYDSPSEGIHTLNLSEDISLIADIAVEDVIIHYGSNEISIAEDGDINALPVVYILRIEKLDPLSLEPNGIIPRSSSSDYDNPGWYIRNTDPAEVFSSKENKTLVIDEKKDSPVTQPITFNDGILTETSKDGGEDTINDPAARDYTGHEGRTVNVTVPELVLELPTAGGAFSGVAMTYEGVEGVTNTIRVSSLDAEFIVGMVASNSIIGQPDVFVRVFPYVDESSDYHNIIARGDLLINPSGPWPSGMTTVGVKGYGISAKTDIAFNVSPSPITYPQTTYNTILLRGDVGEFDVSIPEGFLVKSNNEDAIGATQTGVNVDFPAGFGNFIANPIRVVYATHTAFSQLQDVVDDREIRGLCTNTLVRSFMPTLIDTEIFYSGVSTAEEVRRRFIELVQFAAREVNSESDVRLELNNIITALDEEGISDFFDTNLEVRVTTYLLDGEYVVRYLNPSSSTKKKMAVANAVSVSDNSITLRQLESNGILSGKGKLFLGGNNPETQEVLSYEAVVDNGDGTFLFLIRDVQSAQYAHPEWETAFATVRDYDPFLEFTDGAIIIPSNSRPYVRRLIVTRLEQ